MVSIFLTQYHDIFREQQKKKSETNQILHVPFTITSTLLIIPDREKSLQRAQIRETLVTPQSINY